MEKKVLDELIEQKIIEGYANDWNIKASQEDIDILIQNILSANQITLDELKSNLKKQSSSYDKLVKGLKYEIILKKVKNREISSKLNISDYEIKKHKEDEIAVKVPNLNDKQEEEQNGVETRRKLS